MGLPLKTVEYNDNGGGLDDISAPTKTGENRATLTLNVDYDVDGAVGTRYGSSIMNVGSQMSSDKTTLALFDYRPANASAAQIVCAGTTIKHSLTAPANEVTGLDATLPKPDLDFIVTINEELVVWGNGIDDNLKYNGTDWTNLSIVAPTIPSGADNGVGLLGAGDYQYYVTYARLGTGSIIIQESPVSPISLVTTIGVNRQIQVTIPVSADTQVDARVLYRISPTSGGVAYRLATITNNVDVTYDDNTLADGTIEPDYDNVNAPVSDVFEEYQGRLIIKDGDNPTDILESETGEPWNVPLTSRQILDGEIKCIKKIYNTVLIGTDHSMWVLDSTGGYRKISSSLGILNNRCAVGETHLYIMGTNKKVYKVFPEDLNQDELDLTEPISNEIDPRMVQIGSSGEAGVEMAYFSKPGISKVIISVPVTAGTNTGQYVYNERQSQVRKQHVWQIYDNLYCAVIQMFVINSELELIGGDYNGFIWKLDDQTLNGDGVEENGTATAGTANTITDTTVIEDSGTATSGGANTLTDTGQSWTVNEWTLEQVYIVSGTGIGQARTVASNTVDTLTVTVAWGVVPDNTSVYSLGGWPIDGYIGMRVLLTDGTSEGDSRVITGNTDRQFTVTPNFTSTPDTTTEYSIGGYENYHYTNWKFVTGSYEILKQLWFMWLNANASGDYNITMIMQLDFDTTTANQIETLVNLRSENTIWGSFIWGAAVWGSHSVFLDRFRIGGRFRAMRTGFYHNVAGQPWQINNFAISAQEKGFLFEPI